ncbi:CAP domain-containing protein [Peterkaempfera bronchialis]|uniref:SCP domain-containing protein n=1 Tax=Peterkaempfera bronchialis TaxID=2126346 RepID=A0A345SS74_9ACTN|nr:CAP domain-containing protein [Peterkaempfera bronchialis]AXI76579.1 hypothetical protein C7M71_002925 [Peterkaempfera bronchialis]
MKKLGMLAAAAALVGLAAAPAPARPALPNATTQRFLGDALRAVNAVRARHHAPPLVLDRQLSEYAATRAREVSRWEGLHGGHGGGPHPGTAENIYWGGGSAPVVRTADEAVASWYREVREYDFRHPGGSPSTGRFSQLVWRATTRMGAARVAGQGPQWFETYIVFVFRSPGNIRGEYARNVLPAEPGQVAKPGAGARPGPGTEPAPRPGAELKPGTDPRPGTDPAPGPGAEPVHGAEPGRGHAPGAEAAPQPAPGRAD